MTPANRDRLIVGASAALAIGVPLLLLWPAAPDIHDQPAVVITPLALAAPAITGAALSAPLFSPTRAPEDGALSNMTTAAPDSSTAQPTTPPRLVGIAVSRGGGVALVKTASGDTVQARVGTDIDGWRVSAIASDHVMFEQGGQSMRVTLDFSRAGTSTGASSIPSATVASPPPPGHPGQ